MAVLISSREQTITPPSGLSMYTPRPLTSDDLNLTSAEMNLYKKIFDDDLPKNRRGYLSQLWGMAGGLVLITGMSHVRDLKKYGPDSPHTRRDFLRNATAGLGALALAARSRSAYAQGTPIGYVVAQCDPNVEPDLTKYTWQSWLEDSPGSITVTDIPKDLLPFTIKGMIPGRIYHARMLATSKSGVSPLSRNEVVFVARLPGNCEVDAVPATLNRVDTYDRTRFLKSYGKRRGQAGFDPLCDYNADGIVSAADLSYQNAYFGSVQYNDLQTKRNPPVNSLVDATIIHTDVPA